MAIQVTIEFQDVNGNFKHSETVHISENVTSQTLLVQTLRQKFPEIMRYADYIVLVEWKNQKSQDALLSEGSRIILKPIPTSLRLLAPRRITARKNSALAGDSTTEAPPPPKKKKDE